LTTTATLDLRWSDDLPREDAQLVHRRVWVDNGVEAEVDDDRGQLFDPPLDLVRKATHGMAVAGLVDRREIGDTIVPEPVP